MDISNASYYIQENKENKGSRMGHTKNKYFKKENQKMWENMEKHKIDKRRKREKKNVFSKEAAFPSHKSMI